MGLSNFMRVISLLIVSTPLLRVRPARTTTYSPVSVAHSHARSPPIAHSCTQLPRIPNHPARSHAGGDLHSRLTHYAMGDRGFLGAKALVRTSVAIRRGLNIPSRLSIGMC